ncbi:MAG: DUF192 domain-containing protein [Nitrospirae bacterium]|nr:DUF192 domain-containing protein [Nitrospirota bacterium]
MLDVPFQLSWKRLWGTALGTGLLTLMMLSGLSVEGGAGSEGKPSEEKLVPVTTPLGVRILTELADTTEKRARGLMFRESLAKGRGMLFTFPEPQHWTFWMKNTRIALDIIWLDRHKKIVHVERNVPGCSRTDDGCPQYQPNEEALYVLELAAGMADSLRLERGVKLQFQVPSPVTEPRSPPAP